MYKCGGHEKKPMCFTFDKDIFQFKFSHDLILHLRKEETSICLEHFFRSVFKRKIHKPNRQMQTQIKINAYLKFSYEIK